MQYDNLSYIGSNSNLILTELAIILVLVTIAIMICLQVFKSLVNQGVSVNAKLRHVSEKGIHHELSTPLIAAVYYDKQDFIHGVFELAPPSQQELARHAADQAGQDDLNDPSSYISRTGREPLDVDCTNMLGQTPLMYAASRGNESMVLFLLKRSADRNARDGNGEKAADWAKKNSHQSVYMILVCDPAVSSVHAAIREGNVEATVAFFKQKPDPNQRWFLNHPTTATASSVANAQMSRNVSQQQQQQQVMASSQQNGPMPTMAIEGVLDGEPPLVVAAKFNRVAIMNILFRAPGIDIDMVDTFGKTALMHAAECGHEESVLLLLKHRANRYAMDYSQQTALHYAERNRHASVVDVLEADPYKVFIHDVCEQGAVGLVVALMKQGCPVNFRDERTGTCSVCWYIIVHVLIHLLRCFVISCSL